MEPKIELLSHMGDDLMVVNDARVSLAKDSRWLYDVNQNPYLAEDDEKLINYLAKNGHWTPFGQPQLRFRLKMPLFVKIQWYTHVIGFVRNSESRRYIKTSPEFYRPDYFRPGSEKIKQGSIDQPHENNDYWLESLDAFYEFVGEYYDDMINSGVSAEQARIVLPEGVMVEFIETGSLFAYARLYGLRHPPDAQKEIRMYADKIGELIAPLFPLSWKALTTNWAELKYSPKCAVCGGEAHGPFYCAEHK